MRRPELFLSLLALVVGCGRGEELPPEKRLMASFVNDVCAAHTEAGSCLADSALACSWVEIDANACPAGASCFTGACVTPDPCVGLATEAGCTAHARCAWSLPAKAANAVTLCPVGAECGVAGYCHTRDASGGGCSCLRPLACPANADCPAVQCDCATPPTGGGGGTCACSCPACAPGESCAPCKCDCDGGACGGGSGATGGGTCTCACTDCYGPNCPPCACACGDGTISAGGSGTTSAGTTTADVTPGGAKTAPPAGAAPTPTPVPPACTCPSCPAGAPCLACDCPIIIDACAAQTNESSCLAQKADRCRWQSYGFVCGDAPCVNGYCYRDTTPIDPCAGYTDADGCKGDVADGCAWIAQEIACVTTPCPTGSCLQMKPVPGGCACACPTCVAGESCPPCACDCCGAPRATQ